MKLVSIARLLLLFILVNTYTAYCQEDDPGLKVAIESQYTKEIEKLAKNKKNTNCFSIHCFSE